MAEETDLLTNTGCKTCDHKFTEVAMSAVACDNTLLRDREDARYYLTGEVDKGELKRLVKEWRAENYATDEHEGLLRAADELESLLTDAE